MVHRLVVIGGNAAGMSAASQAMRRRDDLEVVAFERGTWTSYSACGLPYWVAGEVDGPDALVARTPQEHRRRGIDVRLATEVTAVDTSARRITWRSLDSGEEGSQDYDDLVVATGAVPLRPPMPGIDAEGVLGVQVMADGIAVLDELARRRPRRVAVVGCGYIGLEMAEACVTRGLDVTVLTRGSAPLSVLDPDMGELVAQGMRRAGVTLMTGAAVTRIDVDDDGRARGVTTADGQHVPAELVILGLGVRPQTHLAREAGLAIGPSGGIAVDRSMRTSAPGVWAAGDAVESIHRVSGARVSIALGTHANKQGRVAGICIGGGYATFEGVLGTAITKFCDTEAASTGLSEAGAAAAGFQVVTATVESSTRAGYYPGAAPITTKLVVEAGAGRVLGGQIVGEGGAAKRIDTLAAVVWNAMDVESMIAMDLSYAPPFSPTWDPVLITARKALDALEARRAGR